MGYESTHDQEVHFMTIHILTDDRVSKRGFLAEHGLCLLIRHEGHTILFDTGQSDVYLHNAKELGLSLDNVDCCILSHGHYDHGGGLPYFPDMDTHLPVYLQAGAFQRKLAPDPTACREIGFPWTPSDPALHRFDMNIVSGETHPLPNMTLLTAIPYVHHFEYHPVGLYVEVNGETVPDRMADEQILVIETERGLAVFLGCSHPGVINCLTQVQHRFSGKPIDMVMGGMHLGNVGTRRLNETIRHFQAMEIRLVVPLHCTGISAICAMERRLGDRCRVLCAGDTLQWED